MNKIYLDVPFSQKDLAKKLGAFWDPKKKLWYALDPEPNSSLLQQFNLSKKEEFSSFKDGFKTETETETKNDFERRKFIFLPYPLVQEMKVHFPLLRWDPKKKKWSIPVAQASTLQGMIDSKFMLMGENRYFGSNQLFVDYIPESCWFKNVRSSVTEESWDLLRKLVYARVGYKCEICRASRCVLEAHERWSYHEETKVQKLERLIALCRPCHLATHYGFACAQGQASLVFNHLQIVRKQTPDQIRQHLQEAYQLYRKRSVITWSLDLSILENSGINLIS